MKRTVLLLFALGLAIVAVRLSLYTVDAAEYAYVTVLGQHVATYDGAVADDAGLHGGWPWPVQSVQRLDRRLQQFDLPAMEQLTHDPDGNTVDKRLLVEAYVCWRIADAAAVDLFVRRVGTADRARALLGPRVNSGLGAALGQMRMDDLVSTAADPRTGRTRVEDTIDGLRDRLLAGLREPVRAEYGIELVDLRLRRFSHPATVRDSIFARIRSERNKKVTEYQSDGDRQAKIIESEADRQARELLATAREEEAKITSAAEAAAMAVRNDAHRQDPEFYDFLKTMERLQTILGDSKTTLLLSTHRPLFERLFNPPRPPAAAADPKAGAK